MLEKYKNLIRKMAREFRLKYGILALIASLLVPIKIFYFYKLIGISSNFIIVWLITCILTYFLFSSFKNKWIPAWIYFILTILMFSDVTYSSFFNRYLSVNMLGAAGFLGDITESIKEVLKAKFFLLLIDSLLILISLTINRVKKNKSLDQELELLEDKASEYQELQSPKEEKAEDEELEDLREQYLEARRLESEGHGIETINEPLKEEKAEDDVLGALKEQYLEARRLEKLAAAPRANIKDIIKDKLIKILNGVSGWVKGHKKQTASLLIIFVLIFNVSGSFLITSISNQEIYSYHIKDIVGAVTGNNISNESSDISLALADTYSKEKNGPFFAAAKGRNLIVIQLESFQNFVINAEYNGQEITPNLNKLIKENTIYFDNYYQQTGSGNTSDAEFATNNSIYGSLASYTYKLYEQNYFKGLPALLKEKGYETAVYHGYENKDFWNRDKAYKAMGFDRFVGGLADNDQGQYQMTEWMGWGLTDTEFYEQTMPYLKELSEPFYSFVISLSNHHPYIMLDHYNFIDLFPQDKDTIFGNYINSAAYTDYALGEFFEQLKEEGLYDNSIIALYGDHLGLTKTDEEIFQSASAYLGKDYDYDTMMNVPLIITIPQGEIDVRQTVSVAGGQLDFLPTIAYLMGFDSLDTLYLGHNLLTIDSGFVAEQTYMTKGSFFLDDIAYEMSRDGIFEHGRAWNTKTGKEVAIEAYYEDYVRSMTVINASEYILKHDLLRKILLEGESTETVFSQNISADYPEEIAIAGAPRKDLMGTNSLEALNASYEAGYRNIKVDICWTEDKEAVLLKSHDKLKELFESNESDPINYEEFMSLKMKNNLTQMDYLALIAWIKDHPDAKIIAKPERSADFFMKSMEGYAGSIFDRFIVEVTGPVEYSGLYTSILNLDTAKNSAEQLLDYITKNNIQAISLSPELAEGIYKKLLKTDCIIYIEEVENGTLTKRS